MSNTLDTFRLRDINISMALTIAGGWTTLFSTIIPHKEVAHMTHFANYMAIADWGNVEWRILRNGIGVFPYESLFDQIGISTRPRATQPIRFEGGDEIRIDARILAGGADPNDIGIALRGEML